MKPNIDNKGFTLVELMVSIAISVLVITAIAFFMSCSSTNYRNADEDISLQTEAQTILNQLDDLIMEAKNVKFDATTNKLEIFQTDVNYMIRLDSGSKELMFQKELTGPTITPEQMFGQYVESFQVVDTGANKNDEISITLTLKKGSKSYNIDKHIVKIRNRIQN